MNDSKVVSTTIVNDHTERLRVVTSRLVILYDSLLSIMRNMI